MADSPSLAIRQAIRERANFRCEYCLRPESRSWFPFEPDHVIALKHGGPTELENLAFACMDCNRHKGTDLASIDVETGRVVRLFHPRRDRWAKHFEMRKGVIVPRTSIGRVTEHVLQLNRPEVVEIRRWLISKGLLKL